MALQRPPPSEARADGDCARARHRHLYGFRRLAFVPAKNLSGDYRHLAFILCRQSVHPCHGAAEDGRSAECRARGSRDRTSVVRGKRVSASVDIGGRRIIQKKMTNPYNESITIE